TRNAIYYTVATKRLPSDLGRAAPRAVTPLGPRPSNRLAPGDPGDIATARPRPAGQVITDRNVPARVSLMIVLAPAVGTYGGVPIPSPGNAGRIFTALGRILFWLPKNSTSLPGSPGIDGPRRSVRRRRRQQASRAGKSWNAMTADDASALHCSR